jgi:hypothetical protein
MQQQLEEKTAVSSPVMLGVSRKNVEPDASSARSFKTWSQKSKVVEESSAVRGRTNFWGRRVAPKQLIARHLDFVAPRRTNTTPTTTAQAQAQARVYAHPRPPLIMRHEPPHGLPPLDRGAQARCAAVSGV